MIMKIFVTLLFFVPLKSNIIYEKCTPHEVQHYLLLNTEDNPASSGHYQTIYLNAYNAKGWSDPAYNDMQGVSMQINYKKQNGHYFYAFVHFNLKEITSVELSICENGCKFNKKIDAKLDDYHDDERFAIWIKYHLSDRVLKFYTGFRTNSELVATFTDVQLGTIIGLDITNIGEYSIFNYVCLQDSTIFDYEPFKCTRVVAVGEHLKTSIEVGALIIGIVFLGIAIPEYVVSGIDNAFLRLEGLTLAGRSAAETAGGDVAQEEVLEGAEEANEVSRTAAGERLLVSREILAGIGTKMKNIIEKICIVGNSLGIGFDVSKKDFYNEDTGATETATCMTVSAGKGRTILKNPPFAGQLSYCIGSQGKFHQIEPAAALPSASYLISLSAEFNKTKQCVQFVVKNLADLIVNHLVPLIGKDHCGVDTNEIEEGKVVGYIKEHWNKIKVHLNNC